MCPYLAAAVLPLATLAFVLTGPHPWYGALPWIALPFLLVLVETRTPPTMTPPPPGRAGWPFTLLVYALSLVYLADHVLLLRMVARGGFWRWDTVAAYQFFGVCSAFSGIVLGHELIHRRGRGDRLLGRLLCCTLLYEHFYTEHVRGHHVRAATDDDPATARFGESYRRFFLRTVPAQWLSALALERRRLQTAPTALGRLLGSRVVQGALFQALLLAAIGVGFGAAALGVFVVQALSAVRHLEAVNYFQHWGLRRERGRGQHARDAWETASGFSLHAMLGLPRHADHHLHVARPYQELRYADESPQLPRGYLGTLLWVFYRNRRLMDYMTAELRRRRLGPFGDATGG